MKVISLLVALACCVVVFGQPSSAVLLKRPAATFDNLDTASRVVKRICCGEHKKDMPMFLLNGYPISDSLLEKISPNKIQAIDIFKNAAAVEQYGAKAKNGVVSLTVKPEAVDELVKQGILKPVL